MLLPCCLLVVFGLAVGVLAMLPRFANGIEAAAVRFQRQATPPPSCTARTSLIRCRFTRLTVATQRFQSGVINDYVTWLVTGLAPPLAAAEHRRERGIRSEHENRHRKA